MISIFAATAEVLHAAPPGQPEAGWALVSISHVGLCGTDYHIFEGKLPTWPIRASWHELSGTVTAVGEGVAIEFGERVGAGSRPPKVGLRCPSR
ncbi:hypothetical protein X756_13910 [Mesorhizobium sp. LSHC412B00]|nr:hypothetical protein X756_13910 [Mesorhizobium sp. LSHC412B00]